MVKHRRATVETREPGDSPLPGLGSGLGLFSSFHLPWQGRGGRLLRKNTSKPKRSILPPRRREETKNIVMLLTSAEEIVYMDWNHPPENGKMNPLDRKIRILPFNKIGEYYLFYNGR